MSKPVSMSIKDWLIRKTSVNMMMSERVVEHVINHQFIGALDALKTNNSLEFSGFGNFYFKKKRAVYKVEGLLEQIAKMEKLLEGDITEAKRKSITSKMETFKANVELIKSKLDE